MRISTTTALGLLMAGALTFPTYAEVATGDWLGTIRGPQGAADFLVHIRQSKQGVYDGKQDNLERCVRDLPLTSLRVTPTTLSYIFAQTGSHYQVRWDAGSGKWLGTYSQGATTLPVELVRKKSGRSAKAGFAVRLVDDTSDASTRASDEHVTFQGRDLWLTSEMPVVSEMIADASPVDDAKGQSAVAFTLTPVGANRFAAFTRKNVGRRFAMMVGGRVVAVPNISEPITGGKGLISNGGHLTRKDACILAGEVASAR